MGANVNFQDGKGMTALHHGLEKGFEPAPPQHTVTPSAIGLGTLLDLRVLTYSPSMVPFENVNNHSTGKTNLAVSSASRPVPAAELIPSTATCSEERGSHRLWPGGVRRELAEVDPYGRFVRWLANKP
jgi:hypothetical protein